MEDGGNVDGSGLYVYGRVGGLGSDMNGETVRGICARRGCGSRNTGKIEVVMRVVVYLLLLYMVFKYTRITLEALQL